MSSTDPSAPTGAPDAPVPPTPPVAPEPPTPPDPPAAPDHATREQLRAMAHPLRISLTEALGRRGTARAADLAADLGIPPNSVSYHLRTLARGGVVVEAPEAARDRRDRVWKLATDDFRTAPANDPAATDPAYLDASRATSLAMFDWMRSAWIAEMAHHQENPLARPGDGSLFGTTVRLTRAQARELVGTVDEAILRFKDMNRDAEGVDLETDQDPDDPLETFQLLFALAHAPRPPRG